MRIKGCYFDIDKIIGNKEIPKTHKYYNYFTGRYCKGAKKKFAKELIAKQREVRKSAKN